VEWAFRKDNAISEPPDLPETPRRSSYALWPTKNLAHGRYKVESKPGLGESASCPSSTMRYVCTRIVHAPALKVHRCCRRRLRHLTIAGSGTTCAVFRTPFRKNSARRGKGNRAESPAPPRGRPSVLCAARRSLRPFCSLAYLKLEFECFPNLSNTPVVFAVTEVRIGEEIGRVRKQRFERPFPALSFPW